MLPLPFARGYEVSNSCMVLKRLWCRYFLMIASVQEKRKKHSWAVKLEFSKVLKNKRCSEYNHES